MVGLSLARLPVDSHRDWRYNNNNNSREFTPPMQAPVSFYDMIFGFLEEGDQSLPESVSSEEGSSEMENGLEVEEEIRENNGNNVEEDKSFWENQHQILQSTLHRSNSLESKIRSVTKETLKEIRIANTVCACGRPLATGCRKCLMVEVSGRLRSAGYNSAICKSKWRSSPDIPSGEHTFLDVIENSNTSSKKGEVRIIIELNFRAEFEMARASEDYNRMVRRLPEVFVGKVERLSNIIKIVCSAAKKCMKEKKMHMGPWRKHKYMQAKWLGACERTASSPLLSMDLSVQLPKPRASMLTVDLLEKLPDVHCSAVAVV
ncbi:hypothetical protein I3843_10G049200 [Carya illinoinensis]|uniref:Uncharacterized protein n=3 Tax=Carya illinoinensis TaxID=32201 RepID=A0A922DUI8_CARIL|nr:uncharacterized protein LOC122278203 [Carya illinoinensis]KAG2683769.1 hypothetical protein I3760_10G048900 [Carya illinoinensis]KAG6671242.1 hypothetical protein I3843_Q005900 [Carya illinoinensis]KAG6691108.1 hypothetical protein I3842_10G048900 [Carya illinoinensis]KAG7958994.1 hypothetical protein I3843_10G049200 [Carya illinoinensis]